MLTDIDIEIKLYLQFFFLELNLFQMEILKIE